jgi:CRISPR/Cas system-associated exonuclease Cas4 (RecB family)
MPHTLTKSEYMLFLKHPAWLWLKKYDKNKLSDVDDGLQSQFDDGHLFESYANKLFPNAVKLGFNSYQEYLTLTNRTTEAIKNNVEVILQGRLEFEGKTCIFDVLQKVGDNEFNLIEIKASTKAKPEHEFDLAFQLMVLEKSGYTVRKVLVIHVNTEYVRQGEIDVEGITNQTDVTDAVRALKEITDEQIDLAFQLLNNNKCPDLSPRYVNKIGVPNVNWFEEWMDIYKILKPNNDPYNIYNLSYPTPEQIGKLEDANILNISDIPDELALRDKQIAQIKTTRENKRIIDKESIKSFIDTFQYPLYFFDYETFSSVIPQFDGGSPYQDYPFQYSLHIIESPDSEIIHKEYLHSENTNPIPHLLEQLKKDIDNSGTILAWNMSYEKGCNNRMAALYPKYTDFLKQLNDRILDLMTPFSKMWFFDKDFFGSASVKKVMPVMAPELSYKELAVGDGLLARRTWTQTILEGKNQSNRDNILKNLSTYCTLDTFAMVRILEELKKIIKD